MPNQTTNYKLTKPLKSELYNIDIQNENMDIIDETLKEIETEASRHFAVNLLDNSDFTNPVNQRGETSYTGKYSIDRWRTHGSVVVTVNEGSITTSGGLNQYLDAEAVKDCVHTIAAMKADGTIVCYSRNPHLIYAEPSSGAIGLGTDTSTGNVTCRLKAGEYLWAALYEGEYTAETLPTYQPKGYAVELSECRRYSQRIHFRGLGTATSTTQMNVRINFPMEMRIASPTAIIDSADYFETVYVYMTDWSLNPTINAHHAMLRFSNPNAGLTTNAVYSVTVDVYISADL